MSTKPISRSPILDPIHPRDYRELTVIHYCEQCCHFSKIDNSCTMGYDASKHLQAVQEQNYLTYGRVAFCRFIEIE